MSMTEHPSKPPNDEEVMAYSSTEAAMMAGISYRQLDYWLRTGTIGLCHDGDSAPGSGRYRRFTSDEVDILVAVVEKFRKAEEAMAEFRSGALWVKEAKRHGCG